MKKLGIEILPGTYLKRDSYCWTVTEREPIINKRGEESYRDYKTYHASIDGVVRHITEVRGKDSHSLEEILSKYQETIDTLKATWGVITLGNR